MFLTSEKVRSTSPAQDGFSQYLEFNLQIFTRFTSLHGKSRFKCFALIWLGVMLAQGMHHADRSGVAIRWGSVFAVGRKTPKQWYMIQDRWLHLSLLSLQRLSPRV